MSKLEKTEKNTGAIFLKKYAKNISIIFLFIMLLVTLCVVFVLPTYDSNSLGLWSDRDKMSSGGIALLIIDLIAIIIMSLVMFCFRKNQTVPNNNKWFNISLIIGMITFFVVLFIGILSNPEWFNDTDNHNIALNLLFKLSGKSIFEFKINYTTVGLVLTIMSSIALGCTYILYVYSFFSTKQKTVSVNKKKKTSK